MYNFLAFYFFGFFVYFFVYVFFYKGSGSADRINLVVFSLFILGFFIWLIFERRSFVKRSNRKNLVLNFLYKRSDKNFTIEEIAENKSIDIYWTHVSGQLDNLVEDGFVVKKLVDKYPFEKDENGNVVQEEKYRISGAGILAMDERIHKRTSNNLAILSLIVSAVAICVAIWGVLHNVN